MIPLCPIIFICLMLIALVILETTTIGLVEDLPMETDSGIVMSRVIVEKKATLEIETIEIDNSSIAIKKKLRIKRHPLRRKAVSGLMWEEISILLG